MNSLEQTIRDCRPQSMLDMGCGCGAFTVEIADAAETITGIDPFEGIVKRGRRENPAPNIRYLCMDGRSMGFSDARFDLVFARYSLHHMTRWEGAVHEMLRVSRRHVILAEPFDDDRSEAKRNTLRLWGDMLELQREIGHPHYPHMTVDAMERFVRSLNRPYRKMIDWIDDLRSCEEFFAGFRVFAERSERRGEWMDRIEGLEREMQGAEMSVHDRMVFLIEK